MNFDRNQIENSQGDDESNVSTHFSEDVERMDNIQLDSQKIRMIKNVSHTDSTILKEILVEYVEMIQNLLKVKKI